MTDCVYFSHIIKDLNIADTNSGDCCNWSMIECDGQKNIIKLDLSNYEGINTPLTFPPTITFLKYIKEFSIKGQKNIYDIYSFDATSLEKVDLSDSGMNSTIFPAWMCDAKNLKEINISNTNIQGIPQTKFNGKITSCNMSNTPVCSTYKSSPYDYIPDLCKTSCTDPDKSTSKGDNSDDGGSSILPYILIGVAVVLVLVVAIALWIRHNKKDSRPEKDFNSNASSEPLNQSSKSILPMTSTTTPKIDSSSTSAADVEEVARNNYSHAYGATESDSVQQNSALYGSSGNVSVKDIYRQHNASNASFEVHNPQPSTPYPLTPSSAGGNSTTVNSTTALNQPAYTVAAATAAATPSPQEEEIIQNEIINEPPVAVVPNPIVMNTQPELCRRKSSRKNMSSSSAAASTKSNEKIENETAAAAAVVATNDKQDVELYVANWDYSPSLSDELTLIAGDIIEIRKKFDDGWANGFNRRTQQNGIIPICYLKEYQN